MANLKKTPSQMEELMKKFQEDAKALSEALNVDPQAYPSIPFPIVDEIAALLTRAKEFLASYSVILSKSDRLRKVGAGIKNLGFITACDASAQQNAQFLPPFITMDDFVMAMDDFRSKRRLYMATLQLLEELSDSMLDAGDVAYHYALEYYDMLKIAVKHNLPGAKAELDALAQYFKKKKPAGSEDEPTIKQLERDLRGLARGTKEGGLLIENEITPAVRRSERRIIDDVHSGHMAAKNINKTDIKE